MHQPTAPTARAVASPVAAPVVASPSSIQPVPVPMLPQAPFPVQTMPGQPLHAQYRCIACGNEGVQKVSAICSAGHWASHTQGTMSATTIGASKGSGSARGSYSVGVAATQGSMSSNTAGSSQLAHALAPPPRPTLVFKTPTIVTGCYIAGGAALFAVFLASIGLGMVISLIALVLIGLTAYLVSVAMPEYKKTRQAAELVLQNALPRWEQAMFRWDQLFYCSRCDTLYNPGTNQVAPVHQINYLI